MKQIATSAKPFMEQIPARDRQIIRDLECVFDMKVTIHWTNEGWRYDVAELMTAIEVPADGVTRTHHLKGKILP